MKRDPARLDQRRPRDKPFPAHPKLAYPAAFAQGANSRNNGMFQNLHHRSGHYALLLTVALGLFVTNLGSASLWDIDEGNNSEAAREMMESGNWVIPTFNYALRVDKPALLYWLQIGAYRVLGVNEFAARLPSALAALAAILLTYELARCMFGSTTGLLAGIILASTAGFCASAHFANPDALLNAFTLLTLFLYWQSFVCGKPGWFVLSGVSAGLGVLAKGPVGLVLPFGVLCLFLLWSGKLRMLWSRRTVLTALAFLLVALPWYILVATETKAEFLRGFILKHNVGRYLSPMENHRGPIYYYLGVLVLGFAPWSALVGLAGWASLGRRAREDAGTMPDLQSIAAYRFIWSWIIVYIVFFSLAGTKLPNYILPAYAAIAILVARLLDRWNSQSMQLPSWAFVLALSLLALIGVGAIIALLVIGGAIDLPKLQGKQLPGLEYWAVLGSLPILGAGAAWWYSRRLQRARAIGALAVMAVVFVGSLAAWGSSALDAYKAPRALVELAQAQQTESEIRIGCYQYFQPSLVFYCRREVHSLESEEKVLEFLKNPLPAYLFTPASVWESLEGKIATEHRVLARRRDLYRHCDVVVVTNR